MNTITTEQRTCDTHGAFTARRYWKDSWSTCPTCTAEAEAAKRAVAEQMEREARQREYLRESGLIGRFLQASFASFTASTPEQRAVLQACQDFAAGFHRDQGAGLWLIGPPGTGKTHLGAAIVKDVIARHAQRAVLASARDIVRRLRNTWRKGTSEETEEAVLEDLGWAPLLVLDEIGVGFNSDAEQLQLLDVIDRRYRLQRPTVIASNLPPDQIRTALGERSYDRLREGARVLVCNWPSHRGAASIPHQSTPESIS